MATDRQLRRERARAWPRGRITRAQWDAAPYYKPEWLFDGIAVAGTITVIAGDLGSGKTMLDLGLIVKEGFPTGKRFGRLDMENDLDAIILPRLVEMGATFEQASEQFFHLPWMVKPVDVDDVLDRLDDLGLHYLSIDATQDALAHAGIDQNDNQAVMEWFQLFPQRIVDELGITLLLHDHFGWSQKGHPMGATSKLINVTTAWNLRTLAKFGRMDIGTVKLELSYKNRTGYAPLEHVFKIGGRPDGSFLFERMSIDERSEQKRDQESMVLEFLRRSGPLSRSKLENEVTRRNELGSMARADVRDTLKRLEFQERAEQVGTGPRTEWTAKPLVEIVKLPVPRRDGTASSGEVQDETPR